jgi:curli biogenesis system outer membrane secretion channel CsgG
MTVDAPGVRLRGETAEGRIMPRRVAGAALASAIWVFIALSGAMAAGRAAASALQIPPAPALTPVDMPRPPASFCSEEARVRYLTEVFNPAAEVATANATKTADHLGDLGQAISTATATDDIIAAHAAFNAYKLRADEAYRFGLDVQKVRPAIMATAIVPCGPPASEQAYAPPPPSPAYSRPAPARYAAEARDRDPDPPSASRAIPGPRRTIAVGVIQASGGFTSGENWSAGGALSSMLAKTLTESGRFVVVERNDLGDVLNEQQLRAAKVAGGSTATPVKMIPAQYLVVGSVTEFGAPNQGGGLSIGGIGSNGFGGGLGLNRQSGKISVDIRILNPRTGEVMEAFTVSQEVSRTGIALNTQYHGIATGADTFSKTPLGEASRRAMVEAGERIADFVARGAWEGRVVDFDGADMIINAGAEAGLMPGDRLRVERIGRTLTDPDTGQVLSERRDTLGEVVIAGVEPKIARGHFAAATPGVDPQRGDLVIFVAGGQP